MDDDARAFTSKVMRKAPEDRLAEAKRKAAIPRHLSTFSHSCWGLRFRASQSVPGEDVRNLGLDSLCVCVSKALCRACGGVMGGRRSR